MTFRKWHVISIGMLVVALLSITIVKVFRDNGQANSEVPAPQRPPLTVRAIEATRGDVQAWVFAEGTARSVHREYLIFGSPGTVVYVKNLREGHEVKKGDLLARQDQRKYRADITAVRASVRDTQTQKAVAEAEFKRAKTEQFVAQKKFERFRTLFMKKSASAQEYDQAKAEVAQSQAAVVQARSRIAAAIAQIEAAQAKVRQAEVDLEDTELRSPIDGVAAYININEGNYFMPNVVRTDSEASALQTVPIVVIDPHAFEITLNVPSNERKRIVVGQPALITLTGERTDSPDDSGARNGDMAIRGEVYSLTPAVNPGGRSIEVKVRALDLTRYLKDGMFVTVWIATDTHQDVTVTPLDVMVYRKNIPYVFVIDPVSHQVSQREVTLGLQGFTQQEILSGVKPGDLLVTTGRFQLSNDAIVKVLDPPAGSSGKTPENGGSR